MAAPLRWSRRGVRCLVLAVWVAVAWQRNELGELQDQKSALEGQITTLQATVEELAAKGGKIKFNVCGNDRRKCVKVNIGMGTFGKARRELHDFGRVLMNPSD